MADLNQTSVKCNLNTDKYIKWKDLNTPIKRKILQID